MPKPSAGILLAYRFLGWRVGPAHGDWVVDDITRPGWLVRQGAPVIATTLLLGGAVFGVLGGDSGRLLALVFVLAAGGAFLREQLRERALRQQGYDASGSPLPDAAWLHDDAARRRRNVVSAVSTLVLVVGGLVLLAVRTN